MTSFISAMLVGILSAFGWQKLILGVAEDMLSLVAKKTTNDVAKSLATRFADGIKDLETKEK